MSLKIQALAGVKWTSAASLWTAALQVTQLAIVARLIPIEDFGLFATISVILGFAAFFVEAGLSNAVIHRQNASREELANAYVINIALGWMVYLLVFVLAYPLAFFYGDERLIGLIHLGAISFFILPLGMQYSALFQRELKFDFLAKIDIVVITLGTVVAVFLAYSGLGVLSFVWSQIVAALFRTILVLYFGIKKFGFKLSFSWEIASYFLRFGSFQIGEKTVNYFNMQFDVILIGKLLGQEALGTYYMAKQLVFRPLSIINPVITKVALPLFSKIQNDQERLKRGFLQMIHTLTFVQLAVYFLIASFSNEIVEIFLGSGWEGAAALISILSFYVLQRAIGNPVGSLLLAKGRVELGFYWNLFVLMITPFVMFFSSNWGVEGVAWGLFGTMLVLQIPGWYFLVYKLCGASFLEYFSEIAKMSFWALVCFGLLLMIDGFEVKVFMAIIGLAVYIFVNRRKLLVFREHTK